MANNKQERECPCGIVFKPAIRSSIKYCSDQCRNRFGYNLNKSADSTRICSKCGETKNVVDFRVNKITASGQKRYRGECKACNSKYSWEVKLEKVFNITPEYYYELLQLQNNCCAICDIKMEETNKRLIVDHDHETGLVRGLLCDSCNLGIGKLKDSEELLMKAVNYIEKNRLEIKEGGYHK